MRLLNVYTRELQNFPSDDDTPRYAIASHRWSEDELTYQDYIQGRRRDSAGFAKVDKFCLCVRQKFVVRWLWIDTICIDKTNSVELNEAITSMYRWYSAADICIAHLSDVEAKKKHWKDWNDRWGEAFRNSAWHTRGWTLQELLAPKLVVFVDKSFERVIGYKNGTGLPNDTFFVVLGKSLNKEIAEITGIPLDVLAMGEPRSRQLSVEERLSWVARRQTTRPEDKAYCMFGLFGVWLVPIYGERENAMRRLRAEIRLLGSGE